MRAADPIDTARVELLLAELRLPAAKQLWTSLAAQADKEGWPAARFLAALAEHEMAERTRRRIERHLAEARLPPGKTIDSFDFEAVPVVSKAQSWRSPPATPGSTRAPICCCSARPAAARAIWRQRSASRWSKTAGACCSPAPPISSSDCRSHAVN